MQLARQFLKAHMLPPLALPPAWRITPLPACSSTRAMSASPNASSEEADSQAQASQQQGPGSSSEGARPDAGRQGAGAGQESSSTEEMSPATRMMLRAFHERRAEPVPGLPQQQQPQQQQPDAGDQQLQRQGRMRQPQMSAAARRRAEADAEAAEAAAAAQAALSKPPTDAFQVMLRAVDNCKPLMKLRQLKQGTRVLYIPGVISEAEQRSLAIRWILTAAHKRKESAKLKTTTLADCLAAELMLAAQCKGAAREKRDAVHKLALENRALLMR